MFVFGCTKPHIGSWFLNQGSNLSLDRWKNGVLTSGPPGKFQVTDSSRKSLWPHFGKQVKGGQGESGERSHLCCQPTMLVMAGQGRKEGHSNTVRRGSTWDADGKDKRRMKWNILFQYGLSQGAEYGFLCYIVHAFVHAPLLSHAWLFATPWTVACQASLSMEFFQARIVEWVTVSFSRGSSPPKDQTHISSISCIDRQILYH